MPAYKNQHFVPKCVLRQFSPDEKHRTLNLYNIRQDRFVEGAALKTQASSNYMYGKDPTLEGLLSTWEGKFSAIVRSWTETKGETAADLEFMRTFTYLQYRRTDMAVRQLKHAYDALHTNIFGKDTPDRAPPSNYALTIQSLEFCMDTREYIDDLKVRVIQNEADTDFVLSDDPAVFANRYAAQKLGDVGFGVSSSGVIFLMPLAPNLALLCYDGQVYTVPDLLQGRIMLTKAEDVETINEFQYVKAAENVYFRDWARKDTVRQKFEKAKERRREDWTELTVLVPDDKGGAAELRQDGRKPERYRIGTREEGKAAGSALLQLTFKQPVPSRWMPQLKFRPKPRTHYNGTAVGHVRKAEWLKSNP